MKYLIKLLMIALIFNPQSFSLAQSDVDTQNLVDEHNAQHDESSEVSDEHDESSNEHDDSSVEHDENSEEHDENSEEHDENSEEHDKSSDGHSSAGHEEDGGHDEAESGVVELSVESMKLANIEVSVLELQPLIDIISAPGEVQLNQYASVEISPLVSSVVVERHAQLGDEVEANQSLITLASIEVASAQGQLLLTSNEWQRVRKLGKAAVGSKRYTQNQVAYEQARLTLSAYGLDDQQIDSIANRDIKGTLGRFDLTTPLAGTVLRDNFKIGQRIEPGQRLFLIADESQIWIEANLSPSQARKIQIDTDVRINIGGHWHNGKVIQKHHLLDETTRTIPVRISVQPTGEHHHAGEFVQVSIDLSMQNDEDSTQTMTLVVPESALIQDDEQNWTVFVRQEGSNYRQTKIKRGPTRGDRVSISGIKEGSSVVTKGAFFLAAELAKSGFDIHNH